MTSCVFSLEQTRGSMLRDVFSHYWKTWPNTWSCSGIQWCKSAFSSLSTVNVSISSKEVDLYRFCIQM